MLTVSRILGVAVFAVLYLEGAIVAAAVVAVVAFLTDTFDGMVARALDGVTDVGVLLDPIVDRVSVIGVAATLVVADVISPLLVIVVVAREIAVVVGYLVMRRIGRPVGVRTHGKIVMGVVFTGLGVAAAIPMLAWVMWPVVVVYVVSAAMYLRPPSTGTKRYNT